MARTYDCSTPDRRSGDLGGWGMSFEAVPQLVRAPTRLGAGSLHIACANSAHFFACEMHIAMIRCGGRIRVRHDLLRGSGAAPRRCVRNAAQGSRIRNPFSYLPRSERTTGEGDNMRTTIVTTVAVLAVLSSGLPAYAKGPQVKSTVEAELKLKQDGPDVQVRVEASGLSPDKLFTVRAYRSDVGDCGMGPALAAFDTSSDEEGELNITGEFLDGSLDDIGSVSIRRSGPPPENEPAVCWQDLLEIPLDDTLGDIDCNDLPTPGMLEAGDTVDGNLIVSSGDCSVAGTVDGNVINHGSGDVALNGALDGNIELEGRDGSASGDGSINGNIVCKGTDTTSSFSGSINGNIECGP